MRTDQELLRAAESVYDGWFDGPGRIDWEDFIDRLETTTDHDFGTSMVSPLIRKVQRHVNSYRRL